MNPQGHKVETLIADALMLACCLTALTGAVYFGLASCGNYVWRKTAFRALASVLYVLALVLPGRYLAKPRARLSFALGLPLSYLLLESSIAPFYAGVPESIAEYWSLFVAALEFGPCS